MSVIVIDEAMKAKFLAAGTRAEIRDESGGFVGRFITQSEASEFKRPADISLDELAKLLSPERKTYSTAEVLDHLRSLK